MSHTIRFNKGLHNASASPHIYERVEFDKKLSRKKQKIKRRRQKKKYMAGQLIKNGSNN